tara:strand:- start:29285 stop:30922 length:1638 start_codon:yes stop_codon:yes gene_type:complete
MSQEFSLNQEEASPINFERILSAAKRRFLFFLIPFVLILAGSVAVAMLLPAKYSSWGTVLVETQQISPDLVESTITTDPDQRIRMIQQRVMTRENLLKVIDKYNVYGEDRKVLTVSDLVGKMQDEIAIDVITSSSGDRRRNETTIAFTVGFNHQNPQIATDVANELVTLFLSENVRTRTERATEATAFLAEEASKVRRQLSQVENELVAYKQKYGNALPEHLGLRQDMLDRSETEIRDLRRDLRTLEEEKRYLEIELTSARSGLTASTGGQSELARNLSSLKDQLLEASTRLTDNHPTIIALNKRIAALEQQVEEETRQAMASAAQGSSAGNAYNPVVERLQIRIAGTDDRIQAIRNQIAATSKKVAELEAIIIEIPQVERGLAGLNRTYEDLLNKLNDLESRQAQAQLSQNLEEGKKAERFVLLEPPIVPTDPYSPNRKKILGVGAMFGIALGIACVFLIELLDRRIHSASELEAVLKHPPIVSIPYIQTKMETSRQRMKIILYLLSIVVLFAALLVLIHFFYRPLDEIFYQLWVSFDRLLLQF